MKFLLILMAVICLNLNPRVLGLSDKDMETQWRLEGELDELYALAKAYIQDNLYRLKSATAFEILKNVANDTAANPTYTTCPRKAEANGVYTVKIPGHQESFEVLCDAELAGYGWTVIARRTNSSLNFFTNWREYKEGFGNLSGDFFIGLNKLHAITKSEVHELYIHLEDFEGETRYAQYDEFLIESEKQFYAMSSLGKFTGDAGDSLRHQLGMNFTTYDQDNDVINSDNCAIKYMGSWWHNNCTESHFSHLFGLYLDAENEGTFGENGMIWKTWRGKNYSYKRMQMMLRPKCVC
ncbi:uncharacterized protein Dwil_GK15361 [Drosophila willistoni]|uniref:Fibrinogen C-terminal domain-containing protein n=1 Tax=Drosophila willistoni TaxID=7260 RepID=B4MUR2_DROWI|nr:ficolin-2 [Drosophila willistoni]EDW76257.2 uncharacterized protein Dwil_GK15361 [Drosophila willistoni]